MRVAVIGVGSMGKNHARVYSELDGVELISVADIDRQRVAHVAEAHNAIPYSDYKEMLQQEELDAVSIAVPITQHRDVAIASLERGLDLMIEKPLAADVEDGKEILALAQRVGARLMVGHIERYNPAVTELKRQLDQGRIGPVYRIHANRLGPFAERIRDVGVVMDLATHDLEIMMHLVDSQVERVYAEVNSGIRTEHEDLFTGLLRFKNGTVGTLDVSWLAPVKQRQLTVIGEKGMLRLDYQAQTLDFYPDRLGLGTRLGPLQTPGVDSPAGEAVKVSRYEPLRKELETFVDVVTNGRTPLVSGEEALEVVRLARALQESARRGKVVKFPVGGSR